MEKEVFRGVEEMNLPIIFIHDVLQAEDFSPYQNTCIQRYGDFFTQFKKVMKAFEGYETHLLIVAKGIDLQPKWVNYIKQHPEWKPEVHCWSHEDYSEFTYEKAFEEIKRAKEKIEKVFNYKAEYFCAPKEETNAKVGKATRDLSLKIKKPCYAPKVFTEDRYYCDQLDVHYWMPRDVVLARKTFDYRTIKDPLFIIGSPRSGTTALENFMREKNLDAVVFEEKERIWFNGIDVANFYREWMRKNNKTKVIDKNARNCLRILKIQELFSNAQFLHIIRDGRAVANSWRNWAIKTNKYDQTIEGAAYQWLHHVSYVLKNKHKLKNYKEIRYEDLCKKEKHFVSRNCKWQRNLTEEEKKIVEKIQRPLLIKLGYLNEVDKT